MNLIDLLPVVFPQRFEKTSFIFLPLGNEFWTTLRSYLRTIVDSFEDVFHLRVFPGRRRCVFAGESQRFTLFGVDDFFEVGSATVNDFAFGTIDNDVLPLLFVVFIADELVDVDLFGCKEGFV